MKSPAPDKNAYIAPPIKGLVRLIAKAVVEDYRREQARVRENESGYLRKVQHRQAT